MDLTANDCTADATDIADFQWSRTSDGTSITITVDCELDDNLVQVNFNFLAVINALQNDSFGNYKDQKSDEWHNPSAPNTDNSVVLGKLFYRFPVGDRINVIVDAITMGLYDQPIFYDGLGNTYLQLPNLYMVSSKSISLQFTGSVKPTSFEFINGQWNSSVLKTIV